MSKQNRPDERKGEDVSERLIDLPVVAIESTQIWPVEGSGEASLDHNIVMGPLSVEAGYEVVHIEVPHSKANDNMSTLVIVPQAI